MELLKPPATIEFHKWNTYVFLAGSIEMGKAELWQDRACKLLEETYFVVLNPRRGDWDSSWEQSIKNDQFVEQVTWELEGIENSNMILFYFDPDTKSPITLLELGLVAGMANKEYVVVVCPEGFYRKGNVDIICDRYGLRQYDDLETACRFIATRK